ncbi:carboxypeptidase-like regulatory domain-containing protein [uncultured Hymenobacter sp.]|uniref:carboxypeptidase-like regulatory domain-containing protein n=1 Tax=uncultured Hymenobacter sp. TaxID=170016 RepID=UPI0035C977E4
MTPDSLPSTTTESLPAYNPQLDAEDAALSSGNTRLGIIVGALFTLGVLTYALAPASSGGGGGLAAVAPSFLLEGASVTASREAEAAPAPAAPEEEAVAPKTAVAAAATGAPKTAARPAMAAAAAATPAAPSPTPLVAAEVAAAPTAAPVPVAEPVRSAPATLTLSGRILDEEGKPLVGATVLLKGSGKGTSTDANGHYELEAPAGDNSLIFGYGGYQDEEMHTRGAQPTNVTLTPTPGVKRRRR